MAAPLILASASPRRRALLKRLGVQFRTAVSAVAEAPLVGERPDACARRLARAKAAAVARRYPRHVVLAADTVVAVDHLILGKPEDRHDARRMLHLLSGRTHRVLTAVALIDPADGDEEFLVESHVEFRGLTAAEIAAYVESGEADDKAGAYAVQGAARHFIRHLEGSLTNVIGLPLDEVRTLLRRHRTAGAPLALHD